MDENLFLVLGCYPFYAFDLFSVLEEKREKT